MSNTIIFETTENTIIQDSSDANETVIIEDTIEETLIEESTSGLGFPPYDGNLYGVRDNVWEIIDSTDILHNDLPDLDGGEVGFYGHLPETPYNNLYQQDQEVLTTSDVTFNEVTLTDDINAVNGIFSGNVESVDGTFTGNVNADGYVYAPEVDGDLVQSYGDLNYVDEFYQQKVTASASPTSTTGYYLIGQNSNDSTQTCDGTYIIRWVSRS